MQGLHFFYDQQLPIPGSDASSVRYPVCEWRQLANEVAPQHHPFNRFLCSWLSSDMTELSHCDEALQAIEALLANHRQEWFADGQAFLVEFKKSGVQFNPSNVTPEDSDWWNQPEGRFTLKDVQSALQQWRHFLAQPK